VIATAAVYFHKFVATDAKFGSDKSRDVRFVCVACLFLAAKTEETPRQIRSILNVLQYLKPGRQDSGQPPYWPELNRAYWDAKEAIVALEQDILRSLAFNVEVTHPFKLVTLFSQALGCTRDVLFLSLSVVSDSYCDASICLTHSPRDVAVAAIYIAARIRPSVGGEIQARDVQTRRMQSSMQPGWWQHFGTSTEVVNTLGTKLVNACLALGSDTLELEDDESIGSRLESAPQTPAKTPKVDSDARLGS